MGLLRAYADELISEKGEDPTYIRGRTLVFRSEYIVHGGGDCSRLDRLTVEPAGGPIHYIRVFVGGEPVSSRERKRLRFDVRLLDGALLPFLVEWESDRKAVLYAFLPEPRRPGDGPITIAFSWRWPRLLRGLAEDGSDSIEWKFGSDVEQLHYSVVLERPIAKGRPVGVTLQNLTSQPVQGKIGNGWRIEGQQDSPRTDESISVTLEMA